MKKSVIIAVLLALPILVFSISSCQKTKSFSSRIVYLIDSVHQGGSGTVVYYSFSYNENGDLAKIKHFSHDVNGNPYTDSSTFTYFPGRIVHNWHRYSPPLTDTYFINMFGIIYMAKNGWRGDTFVYKGREVIANPRAYFNRNEWLNGNLVKMYNVPGYGFDTCLNVYYPDRAFAPGDYFQLQEFLIYGRSITHNANLLRSNTYVKSGHIDDFTYTFDDRNRVTSCMLTEFRNEYYERFTITYDN